VRLRSCADIPVVVLGCAASMETAYAVWFGSALSVTICGRCRAAAREAVKGAQR
jgi:hypothetical protein